MAAKINGFFNSGTSVGNRNERNLVQTLVDEVIQIGGFAVTYVIRDEEEVRNAWREDTSPEFTRSFMIEGTLAHYDEWAGGEGVHYDLFGLGLSQNATIQISKGRWREEYLDPDNAGKVPSKPQEGDLILVSFGEAENVGETIPKIVVGEHVEINRAKIFEITYVNKDPIKYQLRGEYYYEIQMSLMDYSNEDIDFTNGGTEQNYLFNEQDDINKLSTSGLDAVFANIDEDGNESGNIKDVVKTAQNRDLYIGGRDLIVGDGGDSGSGGGSNCTNCEEDEDGNTICTCCDCECEDTENCDCECREVECDCNCDDEDCDCECCEGDNGNGILPCDDTIDGKPFPVPLPEGLECSGDNDCGCGCKDCEDDEEDDNGGDDNETMPFQVPKGW